MGRKKSRNKSSSISNASKSKVELESLSAVSRSCITGATSKNGEGLSRSSGPAPTTTSSSASVSDVNAAASTLNSLLKRVGLKGGQTLSNGCGYNYSTDGVEGSYNEEEAEEEDEEEEEEDMADSCDEMDLPPLLMMDRDLLADGLEEDGDRDDDSALYFENGEGTIMMDGMDVMEEDFLYEADNMIVSQFPSVVGLSDNARVSGRHRNPATATSTSHPLRQSAVLSASPTTNIGSPSSSKKKKPPTKSTALGASIPDPPPNSRNICKPANSAPSSATSTALALNTINTISAAGTNATCLHCGQPPHKTAKKSASSVIQVSCDECGSYICRQCHWCHEFQANHEIRVCERCDGFYCRVCDEMDQCEGCSEVVCGNCTSLMSCKFCGGGLCEDCATACGRCGIVLCERDLKFAVECDTCKLPYCLVCLASASKEACVRCGIRQSKRVNQVVHLRLKSIYKAFQQSNHHQPTDPHSHDNQSSKLHLQDDTNNKPACLAPSDCNSSTRIGDALALACNLDASLLSPPPSASLLSSTNKAAQSKAKPPKPRLSKNHFRSSLYESSPTDLPQTTEFGIHTGQELFTKNAIAKKNNTITTNHITASSPSQQSTKHLGITLAELSQHVSHVAPVPGRTDSTAFGQLLNDMAANVGTSGTDTISDITAAALSAAAAETSSISPTQSILSNNQTNLSNSRNVKFNADRTRMMMSVKAAAAAAAGSLRKSNLKQQRVTNANNVHIPITAQQPTLLEAMKDATLPYAKTSTTTTVPLAFHAQGKNRSTSSLHQPNLQQSSSQLQQTTNSVRQPSNPDHLSFTSDDQDTTPDECFGCINTSTTSRLYSRTQAEADAAAEALLKELEEEEAEAPLSNKAKKKKKKKKSKQALPSKSQEKLHEPKSNNDAKHPNKPAECSTGASTSLLEHLEPVGNFPKDQAKDHDMIQGSSRKQLNLEREDDDSIEELENTLLMFTNSSDVPAIEAFLASLKGVPGRAPLRKNAKKALKRLKEQNPHPWNDAALIESSFAIESVPPEALHNNRISSKKEIEDADGFITPNANRINNNQTNQHNTSIGINSSANSIAESAMGGSQARPVTSVSNSLNQTIGLSKLSSNTNARPVGIPKMVATTTNPNPNPDPSLIAKPTQQILFDPRLPLIKVVKQTNIVAPGGGDVNSPFYEPKTKPTGGLPAATTLYANDSQHPHFSASTRTEAVLHLSPAVIGWVIGKGGQRIRDVMEESSCRIWIDQERLVTLGSSEISSQSSSPGAQYRVVYVSGGKKNVDSAVKRLIDLVSKAPLHEKIRELQQQNSVNQKPPQRQATPSPILHSQSPPITSVLFPKIREQTPDNDNISKVAVPRNNNPVAVNAWGVSSSGVVSSFPLRASSGEHDSNDGLNTIQEKSTIGASHQARLQNNSQSETESETAGTNIMSVSRSQGNTHPRIRSHKDIHNMDESYPKIVLNRQTRKNLNDKTPDQPQTSEILEMHLHRDEVASKSIGFSDKSHASEFPLGSNLQFNDLSNEVFARSSESQDKSVTRFSKDHEMSQQMIQVPRTLDYSQQVPQRSATDRKRDQVDYIHPNKHVALPAQPFQISQEDVKLGFAAPRMNILESADPYFDPSLKVFVEVLRCEPHFVALLIGRRGWTVKNIQDESGARVHINQNVTPRVIEISATRKEQVLHASQMVRAVLSYPYASNHGNNISNTIGHFQDPTAIYPIADDFNGVGVDNLGVQHMDQHTFQIPREKVNENLDPISRTSADQFQPHDSNQPFPPLADGSYNSRNEDCTHKQPLVTDTPISRKISSTVTKIERDNYVSREASIQLDVDMYSATQSVLAGLYSPTRASDSIAQVPISSTSDIDGLACQMPHWPTTINATENNSVSVQKMPSSVETKLDSLVDELGTSGLFSAANSSGNGKRSMWGSATASHQQQRSVTSAFSSIEATRRPNEASIDLLGSALQCYTGDTTSFSIPSSCSNEGGGSRMMGLFNLSKIIDNQETDVSDIGSSNVCAAYVSAPKHPLANENHDELDVGPWRNSSSSTTISIANLQRHSLSKAFGLSTGVVEPSSLHDQFPTHLDSVDRSTELVSPFHSHNQKEMAPQTTQHIFYTEQHNRQHCSALDLPYGVSSLESVPSATSQSHTYQGQPLWNRGTGNRHHNNGDKGEQVYSSRHW